MGWKKPEENKQILLDLSPTKYKECCLNWSESGGAMIVRVWDVYVLHEVPAYGGEPSYHRTYHIDELDELVKEIDTWT